MRELTPQEFDHVRGMTLAQQLQWLIADQSLPGEPDSWHLAIDQEIGNPVTGARFRWSGVEIPGH